jgi:amidase/aspartyl-tRNA(Asn)/glutamyl-tRNA(Gln) amidotransferase subunit A
MLNAAVSVAEPINKLGAIMADQEDLAKTDSATVLAAKIRRKEVSPVEVVDAAIARIEAFNPKINALIIFGFDEARAAAKEAESAIMRGDEVGALHGVPIAMKDCFDFKPGWVTTFGGIRALKDYVVDTYCMFAERMEQAGAILVGKTNSPVFGFRGTCDNYLDS